MHYILLKLANWSLLILFSSPNLWQLRIDELVGACEQELQTGYVLEYAWFLQLLNDGIVQQLMAMVGYARLWRFVDVGEVLDDSWVGMGEAEDMERIDVFFDLST